jgi:hypothetical protein
MKPYRLRCMRTSLLLLSVVLAACSPAVSPLPSSAPPTAAPASASPTPVASPSATPSPTVVPTTAFVACDLPTWHNNLPSGRLTRVVAATAPGLDALTFQFRSGGDNPGTPFGDITVGKPPFTEGASGQPMSVEGDHFLQVRFEKMDIVDAQGNEIYDGSRDLKPGSPALRQAIEYDAFEGVVGWYVGLSGPTCVSIASDPAALTITLRIAHP